jgi:hypothetical protein
MEILSNEAAAMMRAADLAGLELPDPIKEAVAVVESLEAQIAELPRPEQVPPPARLVADGTPLDKVGKEHARLVAKEKEKAELRDTAAKARDLARRKVSVLMAQERDNLIHALRPIVTALVEEARPLAEALAPYAPKYDAGTIVRHATVEQIEAWRAAEELERKFGACMAAWRAAWSDTTRQGGHPSPARVPDFDVRSVDQAHWYWTWAERVLNPRLNGTYYPPHRLAPSTIQPTVLAVACERPEAGFRLATVHEIADLYYAQNAEARVEKTNRERRFAARAL